MVVDRRNTENGLIASTLRCVGGYIIVVPKKELYERNKLNAKQEIGYSDDPY